MKKIIIPAIVIAAIGGYFYYTNMEAAAPESAIATEVEAAVAEAEAAGVAVKDSAEEMVAAADGDVFADVPEAMETAAEEAEETMEEAADAAEEAMDEMAESAEEVDHSEE